MGVIKPEIIDFEETSRLSLSKDEQQVLNVQMEGPSIPGIEHRYGPDTINKKIGFRFRCADNPECSRKGHYLMCTDWEIAELYRRQGFEMTRKKAMWMARERDLYLMIGTVAHWHSFINVGVLYPPRLEQEVPNV